MVMIRCFAQVREAAGTSTAEVDGDTVAEVVANAVDRFGSEFGEVLATCRVWVDGAPADGATSVLDAEEVAFLPPVSGG